MRHPVLIAVMILFLLAACTPAAPISPVESPTARLPEAAPPTTLPPSETPVQAVEPDADAPTATLQPTQTPLPTATVVPPLGLAADGAAVWCMPQNGNLAIAQAAQPWIKPEGGRDVVVKDDEMQLIFPNLNCTFAFTFNQAAPEGLKLQILETRTEQESAWFNKSLVLAGEPENVAYLVVNHLYITNPPAWKIPFRFRLLGEDGAEYWNELITVKRDWEPRVCWNGKVQDPVTLRCDAITWGDRHPTDWGYHLTAPTPGGEPGSGIYMPNP